MKLSKGDLFNLRVKKKQCQLESHRSLRYLLTILPLLDTEKTAYFLQQQEWYDLGSKTCAKFSPYQD